MTHAARDPRRDGPQVSVRSRSDRGSAGLLVVLLVAWIGACARAPHVLIEVDQYRLVAKQLELRGGVLTIEDLCVEAKGAAGIGRVLVAFYDGAETSARKLFEASADGRGERRVCMQISDEQAGASTRPLMMRTQMQVGNETLTFGYTVPMR